MRTTVLTSRSTRLLCSLATIAGLLAVAFFAGASPLLAQTTPCEAIFEQALAAGIAEADLHMRRQWAMIGGTWVTSYRLEGEKANPFDAARLREQLTRRPPERAPAPAAAAPSTAPPAPQPPISGNASARDVRCNANASSAKQELTLVYIAAGVRFQEGKGPWSAVLPNAVIAAIQLRRSGSGWTVVDRTAEAGVMPPDARRTPPPDTLARQLATLPWPPPKPPQKRKRG